MEFSKRKAEQRKNGGGSDQNKDKSRNSRNDNARGNAAETYVGAPYNFVPFYDKVYEYPTDGLTMHDRMEDGLLTGEITYEVTAETPIMIDNGKGKFFKDAQGRHAIPGSTMRGLIRNNAQVLGLCGYDDDIDDYALMYRNVANGAEKEQYNNTLGSKQIRVDDGTKTYSLGVLLNVHAGYVKNEGGKYVIYKTAIDSIKKEFKGMNYYVLSERKIVNDYLKHGDSFSYGFSRENGRSILQHEFAEFRQEPGSGGRTHYKGKKNNSYKPYYIPVSYEVMHEKDITAVGAPGEYKNEGYAVSTGDMNEKKAVYIIPEIDRNKESITIPEKDVRAFKIDLKKRENTLKGRYFKLSENGARVPVDFDEVKKCFDLPQEGQTRPVFYIELGGRLYFGFTPRLRLFYDHTIKDGFKQQFAKGGVDYCKALFGYSSPEKSFKSRLSFSDAVLRGDAASGKQQKLILAEPKPTSYRDYLMQNQSGSITYNTDGFKLRGAKQYWLHKGLVPADGVKNENAASCMLPLAEGAKFVGKIRFQNLTEDELGLLLWSVRLNEGSQMNVGKAKAYGYGRISVKITELGRLDIKKAYLSAETLELDPFDRVKSGAGLEKEIDDEISFYKEKIQKHIGKPIDGLYHIVQFFMMKDSNKIPDDSQIRYMRISGNGNRNEYQSRNRPLPTVKEIIAKNGGK